MLSVLPPEKLFEVLLIDKADSMSGPIVRTGTTPEFWKNYDRAFGKKTKTTGSKDAAKTESAAAAKKTVKKPAKAAKASSKKAAKKSK